MKENTKMAMINDYVQWYVYAKFGWEVCILGYSKNIFRVIIKKLKMKKKYIKMKKK